VSAIAAGRSRGGRQGPLLDPERSAARAAAKQERERVGKQSRPRPDTSTAEGPASLEELKQKQQRLFAHSREKAMKRNAEMARAARPGFYSGRGLSAPVVPPHGLHLTAPIVPEFMREPDSETPYTLNERLAAIQYLIKTKDAYLRLCLDARAPLDKQLANKHYKRLALLVHPDKNAELPQADQAFKALVAAFEIVVKSGNC